MEMLSGAEMVVQSLVDQGVKQVFGYPGARSSISMMRYTPLAESITFRSVMSKRPFIWRMVLLAQRAKSEWYW